MTKVQCSNSYEIINISILVKLKHSIPTHDGAMADLLPAVDLTLIGLSFMVSIGQILAKQFLISYSLGIHKLYKILVSGVCRTTRLYNSLTIRRTMKNMNSLKFS